MKKILLLGMALALPLWTMAQGAGCWRVFSAGQNFSLGIRSDGTMWAWGQNGNKLGLGLGNLADQNQCTQVGTATDWLTLSAGANHSLAIKTDGRLWSWGNGQFGQLGNGVFNSATPNVTQIGTANDWKMVSAGNGFSLALKNNGTLWAWGRNNVGQLGDGSNTDQNVPIQIGTATDWLLINAGGEHSLALKTNGTLWAWGNNPNGQLGTGNTTPSNVPIQIGTATNWTDVSAGNNHSMALDGTNFLYTWGGNATGQLGDGSNTDNPTPTQIQFTADGTPSLALKISAGNGHSLIIRTDSTLWSSGLNTSGQCALGNNSNTNVFNLVGLMNTWHDISAGDPHSLAQEISFKLWSSGRNMEGQLGIGNNTAQNTLQVIPCPGGFDLEETSLANIELYPNPTPGNLFLVIHHGVMPTNYQLSDLQGRWLSQGTAEPVLNLNGLPTGTYLLHLLWDDGSHLTKRIVIAP
jgi:alpha-tubulin suppressor-like RCC1 family protein